MKEKAIELINAAIHDVKYGRHGALKLCRLGIAQGKIEMAYELGLISQEECTALSSQNDDAYCWV